MGKLIAKSPSSNNIFQLTNFKASNNTQADLHIPKMIDRSITEVTAEDLAGITTIGSNAFYECSHLATITFPNPSIITNIGNNAFRNCTALRGIKLPSGIITIGSSAFYGCSSLTEIEIPDTVTTINAQAFRLCSGVTTLKIGSGVTSIGSQAFRNLASNVVITVTATTPPTLGANDVFSNTGNGPIYVPDGSVNDYIADTNWSTYASRIRPEIQREYPEFTWDGTKVTGFSSGYQVPSDVEIPEGCTALGTEAIYGKTLNSLTLPSTITTMENNSIYESDINALTIKATIPPSGENEWDMLIHKSDINVIYVPAASLSAYSSWNQYATVQAIPTT